MTASASTSTTSRRACGPSRGRRPRGEPRHRPPADLSAAGARLAGTAEVDEVLRIPATSCSTVGDGPSSRSTRTRSVCTDLPTLDEGRWGATEHARRRAPRSTASGPAPARSATCGGPRESLAHVPAKALLLIRAADAGAAVVTERSRARSTAGCCGVGRARRRRARQRGALRRRAAARADPAAVLLPTAPAGAAPDRARRALPPRRRRAGRRRRLLPRPHARRRPPAAGHRRRDGPRPAGRRRMGQRAVLAAYAYDGDPPDRVLATSPPARRRC